MAENKISSPMSSTGILRFYDVASSNIRLDPRHVVLFAVLAIVVIKIGSSVIK